MPMRVHIFDVEHGECIAIETPSGDLFLIGAGHNSTTNWRPSAWVRQRNQQPSCIVLSNLDHDHVSDLPNFEPHLRPVSIKCNHHLNPDWVWAQKVMESGEVHQSVETALHWMKNVYTGDPIAPNYGMEKLFFCHPPSKFQDTNNLSVVTFVRYADCGIMFPGDLEIDGWQEFLGDNLFIECLRKTNILIASHHGRESGYCEAIFEYCKPHAVIISDKAIVHDTQDHDLYGNHCSGLYFGDNLRKVLTTRNDGKMTIEISEGTNYTVSIRQAY